MMLVLCGRIQNNVMTLHRIDNLSKNHQNCLIMSLMEITKINTDQNMIII